MALRCRERAPSTTSDPDSCPAANVLWSARSWGNQSRSSGAKTSATGGDPSIAEQRNKHVPKPAERGIMMVPFVPIDTEIEGGDSQGQEPRDRFIRCSKGLLRNARVSEKILRPSSGRSSARRPLRKK